MPSSVDLGNQLENFIAELVKSGRYNSKTAAGARGSVRDAAIARGIADVDAAASSL